MPTVEIPEGMYDAIVQIITENPDLGYENPEEFIRESIRRNFIE